MLDLTSSAATLAQLSSLSGQGTLRIGAPYFPAVTTNNFDDANTGTVEFYNWGATATLPNPTSGQYNNVRLLNATTTAYTAQLDNNLTLTGSLTLTTTTPTSATPLVTFNLGKAATARILTIQGDIYGTRRFSRGLAHHWKPSHSCAECRRQLYQQWYG
jgi:fibronectin-binding autotransporter adhesin